MVEFIVEISYYTFKFSDGAEAMTFATAALEHQYADDGRPAQIGIKIVKPEEKQDDPLPFE